ncbi:hypothetical protein GNF85_21810, partial [Clostridium perfringens]
MQAKKHERTGYPASMSNILYNKNDSNLRRKSACLDQHDTDGGDGRMEKKKNNMALGISMGIGVGVALGVAMD